MYPEYMMESIHKVEKSRPERLELARKFGKQVFPAMKEDERKSILDNYHPDYKEISRKVIRIGPNKGEKLTTEVTDMLESYARIKPEDFDLSKIDFSTDVLVIGAGSAG
ncbi:MAG: succinate dehydrogenase/fumarate reductase flavoprotein subunit, partial [Candidatus Cloacimonetes bacterium]|nr:succinate dehydrogenase/fumarate reductase flavoprotein subunit [Candidatus Cloacimonadota bacterium]